MSTFYDKLVENGYRPRDLDNLSQDQLAVLVQEEHVGNTWSPEARAAAARTRKRSTNKILGSAKKGKGRLSGASSKTRKEIRSSMSGTYRALGKKTTRKLYMGGSI